MEVNTNSGKAKPELDISVSSLLDNIAYIGTGLGRKQASASRRNGAYEMGTGAVLQDYLLSSVSLRSGTHPDRAALSRRQG